MPSVYLKIYVTGTLGLKLTYFNGFFVSSCIIFLGVVMPQVSKEGVGEHSIEAMKQTIQSHL